MIKRKNKVLASVMASVLLMGNTVPALAADISVTGDTTGQTPTEFAVDEEALGGGLIVTIPASLELVRDTGTGDYGVEDVVSAQGNMNPSKKLQVSTDLTVEYTNADDDAIVVTGTVEFGTDGMEEWTAAETKASLETLDSRAINVTVAGSDVGYVGRYQSVVEFEISLADARAVSDVNSFTWSDDGVSATINGLADGVTATDVEIPSEYNGLPVTSIGDNAFQGNSNIEKITMNDNIQFIGSNSLSSMGDLHTLVLSGSVKEIGSDAFALSTSLTKVFYRDKEYTSATALIEALRANGVTVADDAFANTKLTQVDEQVAMFKWSTTETEATVTGLADNVTETNLEIPSTYSGLPVTSIGNSAFKSKTNVTSITIPDTVTSIATSAFSGCTALETVNLSTTLTEIGASAFSNCDALTTVDLPDTLNIIGQNAFSNCDGLSHMTIPASVTSMNQSFSGSGLQSVTIAEGATKVLYQGFKGCTSLTTVNLPDTVTNLDNYAFSGCTHLDNIDLPDTLTNIGQDAFSSCTNLTSIEIPTNVTSIGSYAFKSSGLTNVTYDGITYQSISELTTALKNNGCGLGSSVFTSSALAE